MPTIRLAFAIFICCSACGFVDSKEGARVGFSGDSASAIVLGSGDVMITSTEGTLVLAVVGDSVRMQLSDSLRQSVRSELDTAGSENELAATIMKGVSSVVNNALGFTVRVHVNDVENLRYENGKIRFDVKGSAVNMTTGRGESGAAQFSEADARRFIDAVEARRRSPAGEVF